jgi:hypothetical protein
MHSRDLLIRFRVEPADRSVGIMSEGFSAWNERGKAYCVLVDCDPSMETGKFEWTSNDGDACDRPKDADLIEGALMGFARGFYKGECGDDGT